MGRHRQPTGLFHGTRAAFYGAGGVVLPGDLVGKDNHRLGRSDVVYITPDYDLAWQYALTCEGDGEPRAPQARQWDRRQRSPQLSCGAHTRDPAPSPTVASGRPLDQGHSHHPRGLTTRHQQGQERKEIPARWMMTTRSHAPMEGV